MAKLPQAIADMQIIATSTLTRPLSAPVLSANVTGPTSAILTWTAPVPTGISIIAGYRLKRAPVVSGPYTTVFDGLALTFTDTFANENWFYTIEAYDQLTTGSVTTPLAVSPSTTIPVFSQATIAGGGETKIRSVIYEPPNGLTVACWIQAPSAVTNYPAFVSYGVDTTPFESYILQAQTIDSSHPADFFFLTGTGQSHQLFGLTSLQPGTQYFIVGTYDGTTACLYINGQLERSANISGTLFYPGTGGLGLGRKFSVTGANFAGTVSTVSIYGSALSAAQILAQYQAVVGVPTFSASYPLAAFYGIAGVQDYPSTAWATYAKFHAFVMGGYWEGHTSLIRQTAVAGIKSASTLNTKTLVFQYMSLNEIDTSTNGVAYSLWRAEAQARNWLLYSALTNGSPIVGQDGGTDLEVNYTTFAGTNPSGEFAYQFGAKYCYNAVLTTTRESRFSSLSSALVATNLDGVSQDNFLCDPGISGDWNRDGTSDASGSPTVITSWLQAGQKQYCDQIRALAPTKYVMANFGGGYGDPGTASAGVMQGVLDGGICESFVGKNWSRDTWQGFAGMLAAYYKAIDTAKNPQLVIFQGSWPDTNADGSALVRLPTTNGFPPVNTVWQWGRYISGIAYLGGGMSAFNKFSKGYSADLADVIYLDEYNNGGNSAPEYLGKPLTTAFGVRPTTARFKGCFVREFDNGAIVVNPAGNGTQTVTNTDIPGNFKFLTGTQDATRNSGAVFSSIALPERDTLFLIRYTPTGFAFAPNRPAGLTTLFDRMFNKTDSTITGGVLPTNNGSVDQYGLRWVAESGNQLQLPIIDTPSVVSSTIGETVNAPPDGNPTIMAVHYPPNYPIGNSPMQLDWKNNGSLTYKKMYCCMVACMPRLFNSNGNNIKIMGISQQSTSQGTANHIAMLSSNGDGVVSTAGNNKDYRSTWLSLQGVGATSNYGGEGGTSSGVITQLSNTAFNPTGSNVVGWWTAMYNGSTAYPLANKYNGWHVFEWIFDCVNNTLQTFVDGVLINSFTGVPYGVTAFDIWSLIPYFGGGGGPSTGHMFLLFSRMQVAGA